ncbi:MAG TPA: PD-(D/E)XK nuclease family protein [Clostridia bacterium]|nr:PD-(D/E)XK nuclease family protein [Clostridia bacterium]
MFLNLIKTNTTREAGRQIINALRARKADEARHFVIVPDRFTLSMEQEICRDVFEDGTMKVDVVSFTRLAIKLLGKKLYKCLSKEGTVVLLNKVITKVNDQLNYYRNLRSYSFAREMFAAIASLRDSKISYEDIFASLNNLSGVTEKKLADIALIYKTYVEELEKNYVDTVSRIDKLTESVGKIQEIASSHIYIYGFNIYSAQQISLIKELVKTAKSVSISFAGDSGGINHGLFINEQMEALKAFCAQNGIPCKLTETYEVLHEPFDKIHKNLFGFSSGVLAASGKEKVVLYSEENPYEEIRGVAREIIHLVKYQGYRYKDIAVVVNDDNYLRIINEIFSRAEIAFFADVKYYVRDTLAVRYINALFEAVEENYAADKVFRLIHNPLSGFTREETECFENYVLKFGINYSGFLNSFRYGESEQAEKARKKLAKLLMRVPKEAKTVSRFAQFVLDEISREDITNRLDEYLKSTDVALSKAAEVEDFVNLISEIEMLSGDNVVSLGEFMNIINSAVADMGRGALPQYLDSVFVGSASDSRFSDVKALFITGASNGAFPATSGDTVILTSFDNEVMKKGGLFVYPTPFDSNRMQRFVAVDLSVKPSEKLYVGFSRNNISGEAMPAGEALTELMKLFQIEELKSIGEYHNFTPEERLSYNLINPATAFYEYMRGQIPIEFSDCVREYLVEKGYGSRLDACPDCDEEIPYAEYLFKKAGEEYNTSVSQLESYFSCPYAHFMKYGLKLKERDEGEMQVNIAGIIIHSMLENYFKRYKDDLRTVSAEETERRINSVIKQVIDSPEYDMYREGMGAYTLKNLELEGEKILKTLTEYVKQSSFTPAYIELGFGRYGERKGIQIQAGGKTFSLNGKVDRVDTCGDKVVIIDYKTGTVSEKLNDIYFGKKIQLYMYLKVFLDEGKTAAGVFYMPIKTNYNKNGSVYKFVGQVYNDLDTLRELDNNFTEGEFKSGIYDFKVKKNKSGFGADGKHVALGKDDFVSICDYVVKISEIALTEISEGFRERKPFESACKYCAFSSMCGEEDDRKGKGVDGMNSFCDGEDDNEQS